MRKLEILLGMNVWLMQVKQWRSLLISPKRLGLA